MDCTTIIIWHVPDPAEQFSNPYLAMGNNPVMYVDPDGEFIFTASAIIIGAMIGSFTGAVAAGYSGADAGHIMASFGVGALAGAVGGAVGQGVTGAIQGVGFWAPALGQVSVMPVSGFFAGAAVGGSAGAASGFVSGFGSAGINGGNIGDMFNQGLEFGWKGAAAGALLGGLTSGLRAVSEQKSFWDGKQVEVGRGRFSLTPHQARPADKLYYVREDGLVKANYQYGAQEKINIDIKNRIGLDATGNTPQQRYLRAVNQAKGRIQINYEGSVPGSESVTITDADGRQIVNLVGNYYSNTEISAFNPCSLLINMTGTPVSPSNFNGVIVRPPFETRVLIYIP